MKLTRLIHFLNYNEMFDTLLISFTLHIYTMNKLTIYLHIGTDKTGSSALQNFLDVNRENLFFRNSSLYPNLGSKKMHTGRYHNHTKWYQDIKDDHNFLGDIDCILNYCQKRNVEKIILSCEGWLVKPTLPPRVKLVQEKYPAVDVKVIAYLRRIDSWIESAWKQRGIKKYANIDEYTAEPGISERFRVLLSALEYWESCIGKEKIIVRAYEKQQLPRGLAADFLSCVGIDFNSFDWEENEKTNLALNYGFNRDVLEMLHLSRGLLSGKADNHLFDLFSELLGEEFQKKPFESLNLLPPAKRLLIIKKNLPYEEEIARKFMGREAGRIFFDPLPDESEPWHPYEGLTLEKTIPIVIKMIEQNYKLVSEKSLRNQIRHARLIQPLIKIRDFFRKSFC